MSRRADARIAARACSATPAFARKPRGLANPTRPFSRHPLRVPGDAPPPGRRRVFGTPGTAFPTGYPALPALVGNAVLSVPSPVLLRAAGGERANGRGKPRPYGHAGSLFEERRGGELRPCRCQWQKKAGRNFRSRAVGGPSECRPGNGNAARRNCPSRSHRVPSSRHSRCGRRLKTCHRHVFLTPRHAAGNHA